VLGAGGQDALDGPVGRVAGLQGPGAGRLEPPVAVPLAPRAGGHAARSFATRIRKLAKTAVLICDDFAMREFTAAQADDLYELLTERIGRPGRSLILTSNRSPADWYPLFPNAVVGESILDRVLNTSHHLLLEGKSYRPRRRPGQPRPGPAAPRPP